MSCAGDTHGGLMPPAYFFLAILLMIGLQVMVPGYALIPPAWRFVGLFPLGFGGILNLAADRAFKKAGTPVHPHAATTTLLQTGVFAFTRNPMYLGAIFILIGIGLLFGSLTPGLVPLLFALLLRRRFVLPEERKLADSFAAEWDAYAARVRRWV